MQTTHLLQKPFITVEAIFADQIDINDIINDTPIHKTDKPSYTFKAEIDSNLLVGDYAVVHAQNTLKIVQIVAVHDLVKIDAHATFEYKWVIGRIDFQSFCQRRAEEERIDKILTELHRIEAENHLQKRLEAASQQDDNFADLLKDFLQKSLT